MKTVNSFLTPLILEAMDSGYDIKRVMDDQNEQVYTFNDGKTDYSVRLMRKWSGKVSFGLHTWFIKIGAVGKGGKVLPKIGNPGNMGKFLGTLGFIINAHFYTVQTPKGYILELPEMFAKRANNIIKIFLSRKLRMFVLSDHHPKLNGGKKAFYVAYHKNSTFEKAFANLVKMAKTSKFWDIEGADATEKTDEDKGEAIANVLSNVSKQIDAKTFRINLPTKVVGMPKKNVNKGWEDFAQNKVIHREPKQQNPKIESAFKSAMGILSHKYFDDDGKEKTIYFELKDNIDDIMTKLNVIEDSEDRHDAFRDLVNRQKPQYQRLVEWQTPKFDAEDSHLQESLSNYTGSYYSDMNKFLHGSRDTTPGVKRAIKNMDELFSSKYAHSLPKDTTVYRGIKIAYKDWLMIQKDKIFYNPGFVSTSFSFDAASSFSDKGWVHKHVVTGHDGAELGDGEVQKYGSSDYSTVGLLMVIRGSGNVPTIIPGKHSNYVSECEVVFDRGTFFHMKRVIGRKENVVVAEFIPNTAGDVNDEDGNELDLRTFVSESTKRVKSDKEIMELAFKMFGDPESGQGYSVGKFADTTLYDMAIEEKENEDVEKGEQ